MTPEELDEARAKEAEERWRDMHPNDRKHTLVGTIAARLAREGWTPPEPVDPDILAFREWIMEQEPEMRERSYEYDADFWDNCLSAKAYLAGARMAREQERERADMPIRMAEELAGRFWRLLHSLPLEVRAQLSVKWDLDQVFAKGVEGEIAKYRGEA